MKPIVLVGGLLLAGGIGTGAEEDREAWGAALAAIGLTKADVRLDFATMDFYGGGPYRQHLFQTLATDPWKIPDYGQALAEGYLASTASIAMSLYRTMDMLALGVRRNLIGNPVEGFRAKLDPVDPVGQALSYLAERAAAVGFSAAAGEGAAWPEGVPVEVAREMAVLLIAIAEALPWRERALAGIPPEERAARFADVLAYLTEAESGVDSERQVETLPERFDPLYLHTAAMDLALTLDAVKAELVKPTVAWEGEVRWATPLGPVVLGGVGPNVYPADETPLLIVDLGGDDTYFTGGATPSADRPVALLMDVRGNDRYEQTAPDRPSFGAGLLGYGFAVDLSGDDVWYGVHATQGFGSFGVGVCWDGGGNDFFTARTKAQGAGAFGVGLLVDRAGNDVYDVYQEAQGYGFVLGAGTLVDAEGNDAYRANDTDIVFPSPQTQEHNVSLAQGMGYGKRADYTDGHSLAGGVGLLVDGAGDDQYSCGVFGQGQAYWYGVGLLYDKAGHDSYQGVWYVQGAGAHFGVGVLLDQAGNDRYRATMNMAQGAGHDFTVGFLIDAGGDDVYEAPNLSLGGGNANGIGLFWDRGGRDSYQSGGTTLGRANPAQAGAGFRPLIPCLGVFLDEGGEEDIYAQEFAGNNRTWTQAEGPTRGVGMDR